MPSFSPLQESLSTHARLGLVAQLQSMGFSREGAMRALEATQHSGARSMLGCVVNL